MPWRLLELPPGPSRDRGSTEGRVTVKVEVLTPGGHTRTPLVTHSLGAPLPPRGNTGASETPTNYAHHEPHPRPDTEARATAADGDPGH